MATLPSPDFTCNSADCLCVAGIRPYRQNTFRLAEVNFHGKVLIHNYGHGGAGISMSWGCAVEVRGMVVAHGSSRPAVAVLGAGVMGLTAATLLQDEGYPVTIYAKEFDCTTSFVAGGQWAPSIVDYDEGNSASVARFKRILRNAYDMHYRKIGLGYGVSERTNYTKERAAGGGLEKAVRLGILSPPAALAQLPFARLNTPGFAYETLLVEPPILLAKLKSDLQPHVPFVRRTFASQGEIAALSETIIVNCTGYGSKDLFRDSEMQPKKGHLVLLRAQPNLQYLFSAGTTYVFPRQDHVVVGGSQEPDDDETPNPTRCQSILQAARDVFDGRILLEIERQSWMLADK